MNLRNYNRGSLLGVLFLSSCSLTDWSKFTIEDGIYLNDVKLGCTIQNSLSLENKTKDTIFIDTIYTSCSCVKLRSYFTSILPYTEKKLKYEFMAEDSGYVVRGISIKLKDCSIPHHYKIEAVIKP